MPEQEEEVKGKEAGSIRIYKAICGGGHNSWHSTQHQNSVLGIHVHTRSSGVPAVDVRPQTSSTCLIHTFSHSLLSTCCVPGSVLGSQGRKQKDPGSHGVFL